jgi:hypothetical protein
MVDVERLLRTWMLQQAAIVDLVDDRVYAARDVPPVGVEIADGPCVVLKTRGGMMDYADAIISPSFQVKAYGRTEQEAMQLYRALFESLQGMVNSSILHAEMEAPGQPLEEPDTHWPFVLAYWTIMFRQEW